MTHVLGQISWNGCAVKFHSGAGVLPALIFCGSLLRMDGEVDRDGLGLDFARAVALDIKKLFRNLCGGLASMDVDRSNRSHRKALGYLVLADDAA